MALNTEFLTKKFLGIPAWGYAAGIGAVGYYFYRKNQANKAADQGVLVPGSFFGASGGGGSSGGGTGGGSGGTSGTGSSSSGTQPPPPPHQSATQTFKNVIKKPAAPIYMPHVVGSVYNPVHFGSAWYTHLPSGHHVSASMMPLAPPKSSAAVYQTGAGGHVR